jgi:hypothetical protein
MLDPVRYHRAFAGIERDDVISEFDAKDALPAMKNSSSRS